MAISSTTLTLSTRLSTFPGTQLDPIDKIEQTTEYTYNLTQDATRVGYLNLGAHLNYLSKANGTPMFVNGQGGNDQITLVNELDDVIHAGSGDDVVDAGGGSDVIWGGSGLDKLSGNFGKDILRGGSGSDTLDGNAGVDVLYGGSGHDKLDGGGEGDYLNGGSGRDIMFGHAGIDTLIGGTGDDQLRGEIDWSGDIFGRALDSTYNDILKGGGGNDLLNGGIGADVMTGGEGADVFKFTSIDDFEAPGKSDYITDFSRAEGDVIDFYDIQGNPPFGVARSELTFSEGPSADRWSFWLGDTDAAGDQTVFINLSGGEFEEHIDRQIMVHVGAGDTLLESDFL